MAPLSIPRTLLSTLELPECERLLIRLLDFRNAGYELFLRIRHVVDVEFSHDTYLYLATHSESDCGVDNASCGTDRRFAVEENIYLFAFARMHRVCDNAIADVFMYDAVSAIGIADVIESDRPRGYDFGVGVSPARRGKGIAVSLVRHGVVPSHTDCVRRVYRRLLRLRLDSTERCPNKEARRSEEHTS